MSDLFSVSSPPRDSSGGKDSGRPPLVSVGIPDGELLYQPDFYDSEKSAVMLNHLLRGIPWAMHQIRIFGRWVNEPRQTAWYGDSEAVYTYSGVTMKPSPWTAELNRMRRQVEAAAGTKFNSVLLNLYRDGRDSMGWHSDDESELGPNPAVASLSFGSERRFLLRHRARPEEKREFFLTSGSLLVMRGALQHHWVHSVPKSLRVTEPRINLTFRQINPASSLL